MAWWKHNYQNLKPYEIVIEDRDPILGINSPDAPAWFSRIQKRKWKIWMNRITGKEFVRKSKHENERVEKAGGWCPSNVVEYDNHYFVWRNATVTPWTIQYWWDVSAIIPYLNQDLVLWFGEQNSVWVSSVQITLFTLQAIAEWFQQQWLDPNYPAWYVLSIEWNNLIISWTWVWPAPIPLTTFVFGAYDPINWVFLLPTDVDWNYSYPDEIITPWTETLWDCEIVRVTPTTFDCTTDEVFFTKPLETITLNGEYVWWSNPESVQRGTVQQRDNRTWEVNFTDLETDWLPLTTTPSVSQAFASFNALVTELNNQLITYGSTFRLVAVGNDRVLVADINYNVLPAWDPYFSTNQFNNMSVQIVDSVTGEYLIKWTNPKAFTLSNVTYQKWIGGMYKGTIWCWGWGSLPIPKVMLDNNNRTAVVSDLNNTQLYVLSSPPVVNVQDLTQAQIDAWVRIEFLYYRTAKHKTSRSKSWKAWFVHPAPTDSSSWTAIYLDWTRWWYHNWVAQFRPSEFPVIANNTNIPVWEALHSRFRDTSVAYRDVSANIAYVNAPCPNRMQQKIGNLNYVWQYKTYSTKFRPLYIAFRYAIRKADWTRESWPMSKTFAVTTLVHPFRDNAAASAIHWLPVTEIDRRYNPYELKVFQATHRL